MACTSFQYRTGETDFDIREIDRILNEPLCDSSLNKTGVHLDLGQLHRLVLPPGSNGECGHGHGSDQSQGQNKYDNLSHIFLTFVVGSTTRMDGAFS